MFGREVRSGIWARRALMGQSVLLSDRCCGEAGTFAVSRPDIATQVRFRKQQEIEQGVARLTADGYGDAVKILTSCPSCLQGLQRYRDDVPLEADHIVVELAKKILGRTWLDNYVRAANTGGIKRVLL